MSSKRGEPVWVNEEIAVNLAFTYKADGNQVAFLQLVSTKAEQEITYHCKNSVAYFDADKSTFRNSAKLMAWNDLELTAKGNKRFTYAVKEDGCQNKSADWAKTVFSIEVDKPQRLPIVDMGLRDIGESDQTFKIEVGKACFM